MEVVCTLYQRTGLVTCLIDNETPGREGLFWLLCGGHSPSRRSHRRPSARQLVTLQSGSRERDGRWLVPGSLFPLHFVQAFNPWNSAPHREGGAFSFSRAWNSFLVMPRDFFHSDWKSHQSQPSWVLERQMSLRHSIFNIWRSWYKIILHSSKYYWFFLFYLFPYASRHVLIITTEGATVISFEHYILAI